MDSLRSLLAGILCPIALAVAFFPGPVRGQDVHLTWDQLVADTRQLAGIMEDSHPDPYSHSGGRISFHRRLDDVLTAIPREGMKKEEFLRLLRPFVAAVGDQHTEIYSEYPVDGTAPGGVPFVFEVVERSLYVLTAFTPADQEYVGSLLVSVEGVSVPEIVERLSRLEGVENEYYALRTLGRGNLLFAPYLQELVPDWKDLSEITITLRRPAGETEKVTRALPVPLGTLHLPESRVDLPATDKSGFLCEFLDPLGQGREIAYLRVDHMEGYRESHEMAAALGADDLSAEERALVPSATESFRDLVVEMKKRGTSTLIVDLRQNGGGNYMMAPILIYFLHGKDALTSISKRAANTGGGHGQRYSALYFETYPAVTLESINEGRDVPLVLGDIDFAGIRADRTGADGDESGRVQTPRRLKTYRRASTFYAEYESDAYAGHYLPEKVLVLISPWTSSSGLDMTLYLYRAGATLIGTPSAQSPNSYGETLKWRLEHSGIEGEISRSFDIAFGDDPARGRVLPVHYPLTYEKLASYDFDPNATLLYAMELLPELEP